MSAFALDARVLTGRALRHSARNVEALMTAVMLPVILMLLFVYVFGGAMDTGGPYVDYVVPGIIVLCAGFGAASTATSVVADMTNGVIDRLRTMPVSVAAVVAGHVVASIARNVVATVLVVGVGLLVGWEPSASVVQWLAAAALVLLYITSISVFSALVGLLVTTTDGASGFTFVLMFLPYVSSAFVPVDTLPDGLRAFAEHQPVTPVIETLRGLWFADAAPAGSSAWTAIAWLVAIGVASGAGAVALLRRRTAG